MTISRKSKVEVLDVLPVFRPTMGQEEIEAVAEVMKSGWIGLGPKTEEFERKFAKFVNVKYAVGLNSATAALHLSLLTTGIGPGDEVLIPSLTFISTGHAVLYLGATPVFVDVSEDTLCMDPVDLQRKITKKSKAVIPVDYGGHPADLDSISHIAKVNELVVIEDASHATGSKYKRRMIGSICDLTCFSFHAVKNLATGDGGMVTTNNLKTAQKLRNLRWMGINKNTWEREELVAQRKYRQYGWYYDVAELGYKYHMNDIAAAIGLVQLKKLNQANKKRRKLAARYTNHLRDLAWIETPIIKDNVISAQHNYVIKTSFRDELNLYLKSKGISTGVHYMPIHHFTFYKRNLLTAKVPVTEEVWKRLLTLPLYPTLSIKDQNRVIKAIKSYEPQKS